MQKLLDAVHERLFQKVGEIFEGITRGSFEETLGDFIKRSLQQLLKENLEEFLNKNLIFHTFLLKNLWKNS